MEKITAEKVANFVFDNAEIMKRQQAMDAFEKRMDMTHGMDLKKKKIELNGAKLEKMDADIFKTRAQAKNTMATVMSKMRQQEQQAQPMDQMQQPPPQQVAMPKYAAAAGTMPGASTGGMKPSTTGNSSQRSGEAAGGGFGAAAQRGTDMRQVPEVPEAAPMQSAGAQPTGFVPPPMAPPEINQPLGMPKNVAGVPVSMTAKMPKFASVNSLSKSPNDSKTSFQGKNMSSTIKLFPQIKKSFA